MKSIRTTARTAAAPNPARNGRRKRPCPSGGGFGGTSVAVGELPDEKTLVNVHWDEEKAEDIFAYACYRKVVPVEKELLSGMDPCNVRSLRISVGGRVVAVVSGVTQFTGIGLDKSPNDLGDSGWGMRLDPAKRYYLFEARSLPAASDWANDSY